MQPAPESDVARLAAYLRRNRELHLYELGDLDDFFFPHTRWWGSGDAELEALCLVYEGSFGATLLAFADPGAEAPMQSLLRAIEPRLPARFHAHLSNGLARSVSRRFELTSRTPALKLALRDTGAVAAVDTAGVVAVDPSDLDGVESFYRASYPGNWFDPRMLETGRYCGVRDGNRWLAIAGVHVYSREYRVAALGNIASACDARGRGLGAKVTAALCQTLLRDGIEVIGLNVMRDNEAALRCYRKLGFETIAENEELEAQTSRSGAAPLSS